MTILPRSEDDSHMFHKVLMVKSFEKLSTFDIYVLLLKTTAKK